jgi:hypothetical protein
MNSFVNELENSEVSAVIFFWIKSSIWLSGWI